MGEGNSAHQLGGSILSILGLPLRNCWVVDAPAKLDKVAIRIEPNKPAKTFIDVSRKSLAVSLPGTTPHRDQNIEPSIEPTGLKKWGAAA